MPRLLSVNAGLPRELAWRGKRRAMGVPDRGLSQLRDGTHQRRCRYRLEPVEPPADGNTLICCYRPEGDIVIDL
jgi:hypothetical protein